MDKMHKSVILFEYRYDSLNNSASENCKMQAIEVNSQMMAIAQMEAIERRNSLRIPMNLIPDIPPGGPWTLRHTPSVPPNTPATPFNAVDYLQVEQCDELLPVYHRVVANLTELLNTKSVRSDKSERSQIQEQLMEAQHKCRRQRHRRSLDDDDKRGLAHSISRHVRHNMKAQ